MEKMRIIYLYCAEEVIGEADGKTVAERTVCTADRYIIDRLKSNNHEVELLEYSDNFVEEAKKLNGDFIFNGADAFDGVKINDYIIKQLEETGLPFSGCNREMISLLTNKVKAKDFFRICNARTPEYQLITDKDEKLNEILKFPLIIKPAETDASVGIDDDSVVYSEEALRKKLEEVMPKYGKLFVEEYVNGREFCVPTLFSYGNIEVFPILEIDFTEHFENKPKILSFKAKWSKNTNAFKNTYSLIKQLEPEIVAKIKEETTKVFTKLKGSGYATMDIRYDGENVFILEVNPNPYLAIECDFIKSAKAASMTSNEFIDIVVKLNNPETIMVRAKN